MLLEAVSASDAGIKTAEVRGINIAQEVFDKKQDAEDLIALLDRAMEDREKNISYIK